MYMEGGSTMLDTVPTIMEEVLYNVCDNAIKYNHRGGEVFVQLKDEGDVVRINVRDTGNRDSERRSGTHFRAFLSGGQKPFQGNRRNRPWPFHCEARGKNSERQAVA